MNRTYLRNEQVLIFNFLSILEKLKISLLNDDNLHNLTHKRLTMLKDLIFSLEKSQVVQIVMMPKSVSNVLYFVLT